MNRKGFTMESWRQDNKTEQKQTLYIHTVKLIQYTLLFCDHHRVHFTKGKM